MFFCYQSKRTMNFAVQVLECCQQAILWFRAMQMRMTFHCQTHLKTIQVPYYLPVVLNLQTIVPFQTWICNSSLSHLIVPVTVAHQTII